MYEKKTLIHKKNDHPFCLNYIPAAPSIKTIKINCKKKKCSQS